MRPLAIDLYCGLGGWTDGLLAEGWDVIGFDIEAHVYGGHRYPAQLVVQDVLTLHGSQFAGAGLIVASPPCQEYSYMAMPWSRAKRIARALRGEDDFPEGYRGSRAVAELNALFDACFRIQREASEAAGRHVPMVVENVRGAQPWVGRAAWNFGSYYLWGDVPALMPVVHRRRDFRKSPGESWATNRPSFTTDKAWKNPGHANARDGHDHTPHLTDPAEHAPQAGRKSAGLDWSDREKRGQDFTRVAGAQAIKNSGGSWFNIAHNTTSGKGNNPDGRKHGSRSTARKLASAMIAKIPLELSRHVARVYRPPTAARTPPRGEWQVAEGP